MRLLTTISTYVLALFLFATTAAAQNEREWYRYSFSIYGDTSECVFADRTRTGWIYCPLQDIDVLLASVARITDTGLVAHLETGSDISEISGARLIGEHRATVVVYERTAWEAPSRGWIRVWYGFEGAAFVCNFSLIRSHLSILCPYDPVGWVEIWSVVSYDDEYTVYLIDALDSGIFSKEL